MIRQALRRKLARMNNAWFAVMAFTMAAIVWSLILLNPAPPGQRHALAFFAVKGASVEAVAEVSPSFGYSPLAAERVSSSSSLEIAPFAFPDFPGPRSATVPEPASLALLAPALFLLHKRPRRA